MNYSSKSEQNESRSLFDTDSEINCKAFNRWKKNNKSKWNNESSKWLLSLPKKVLIESLGVRKNSATLTTSVTLKSSVGLCLFFKESNQ